MNKEREDRFTWKEGDLRIDKPSPALKKYLEEKQKAGKTTAKTSKKSTSKSK